MSDTTEFRFDDASVSPAQSQAEAIPATFETPLELARAYARNGAPERTIELLADISEDTLGAADRLDILAQAYEIQACNFLLGAEARRSVRPLDPLRKHIAGQADNLESQATTAEVVARVLRACAAQVRYPDHGLDSAV